MLTMKAVLAGNAGLKQLEAVQKEWRKALREEDKAVRRLYYQTYHNWKPDHQPQVRTRFQFGAEEWYAEIVLKGRIYWFVHESIDRLRAVFSDNWRPKTQPNRLHSRGGSGKMVFASKAIDLDPYKAREFTETIIKVEKKPFEKRMQHATAVGARKATQGG